MTTHQGTLEKVEHHTTTIQQGTFKQGNALYVKMHFDVITLCYFEMFLLYLNFET
jgi:hypothetical protein